MVEFLKIMRKFQQAMKIMQIVVESENEILKIGKEIYKSAFVNRERNTSVLMEKQKELLRLQKRVPLVHHFVTLVK